MMVHVSHIQVHMSPFPVYESRLSLRMSTVIGM